MKLVDHMLQGHRLSLARVLTQVENNTADGQEALRLLFPKTGRAHLVGVTGASGTGKSSLVNRLAMYFRAHDTRVAIAAVDPSSPFSGGAVLGDRIRMKDLAGDQDVFIRSMASRGALGGLARTTAGVVQVLDAAGYDVIFIETVGAGQAEVDIASLAHTTLVVEAPGMGDDIQAIKAGILEIADILVVNKADRPGAENAEKALRSALELAQRGPSTYTHHGQAMDLDGSAAPDARGWTIPIQRTISIDGNGIPELAQHIQSHLRYLQSSSGWADRNRARLAAQVEAILQQTLVDRLHAAVPEKRYNEIMQRVFERNLSPSEAVSVLLDDTGRNGARMPRATSSSTGRPRVRRSKSSTGNASGFGP
jgi:LAO/AO transport system kinase